MIAVYGKSTGCRVEFAVQKTINPSEELESYCGLYPSEVDQTDQQEYSRSFIHLYSISSASDMLCNIAINSTIL